MDITVRVEVQYVAPEHALIRDVLQMFRTPAWVRFMVRYISPHLKNAAPADKSVMDNLASWTVGAKRSISSISPSSSCAQDCVICLSELQNGEEQFVSLPCGHQFHLPCIRSWLKLRSTCPSCRFQFRKAFSGSYAVRTLNSALLLKQEHRPLPKEQILNTCVGRETIRAVVNVTLSQIAAHAKQSQYPCVLNALMMHSNGDSFTEAAVTDAALAKSSSSSNGDKETKDGGNSESRAKRTRVA
ncbi:Zinc finger, RING/FYVE/PHD-type [Phytophthora cactorum]|nr:Zinc finger, RING/FYVE/PHD-type [Phytophthora cactorum]